MQLTTESFSTLFQYLATLRKEFYDKCEYKTDALNKLYGCDIEMLRLESFGT